MQALRLAEGKASKPNINKIESESLSRLSLQIAVWYSGGKAMLRIASLDAGVGREQRTNTACPNSDKKSVKTPS